MGKNNTSLTALWGAAILSITIGLLLSIHTLGEIGRTSELWHKKTSDLQEMAALRATATEHRRLLKQYAHYPATPIPLGELVRTAAPGLNLITRATETHPSVPGWTARKVNIGMTDISGNELARLLDAITVSTPPWAVLECTLLASPTPGRLAKVELSLETVEKQSDRL